MIFKRFSIVTFVSIFMSINIADAMKRSHDEAFESETDSSSSSTSSSSTSSSTSQAAESKQSKTEPKTIELSLNPRLVHDHDLREFKSIEEACKAYGIEQEYSGGHPVSDEMVMYSLQTEIDENVKDEDIKKECKELVGKYTKYAALWSESWSEILYPSQEYRICETNKGDFTIAEEFMELAARNHFDNNNDTVRVAILGLSTGCFLNKQNAPRFFEALTNIASKLLQFLTKVSIQDDDIYECRYKLYLGVGAEYNAKVKVMKVGFLLCKNLTNDEIMFLLVHELTHVSMKHCLLRSAFKKLGLKHNNELNRVQEQEADSIALLITKKPYAMITCILKLIYGVKNYGKNVFMYFKNKNSDQLVEHVKLHFRIWLPDITLNFETVEQSVKADLERFITNSSNSQLAKQACEDLIHPTSFERICYALSQDKLQDKKEAKEQQ